MIKLAFYKAKTGDILDKIISFLTNGQYSHVELVFDDICFSSSYRDSGVRFKQIDLNDDHWDIVDISDIQLDYDNVNLFCKKQLGKKYDLIGTIFGGGLNLDIQDKNKWFCTEIILVSLFNGNKDMFKIYDSTTVNPTEFYNIIMNIKSGDYNGK